MADLADRLTRTCDSSAWPKGSGHVCEMAMQAAIRIRELEQRLAAAEKDAERYRWLKPRYFSVDWAYGSPPESVITFKIHDMPVSADIDATIDAARGAVNSGALRDGS